jgi:hypothetical protein
VRGERAGCRRYGFDGERECRLLVVSDAPEYTRVRLFVGPERGGAHPKAIVLETANFVLRRAADAAREP